MATETFNSGSGTWFVPTGQELTQIELWGAGGGGASGESGSGDGTRGGGGGGGGYCKHVFGTPIAAGTGVAYSVGAAGAGDKDLDAEEDGGNGGATTCSTYSLTANGGSGGTSPSSTNAGGAGGTASGGNTTNTTGTAGGNGEDNGGNGLGGAAAGGGGIGGASDGANGTAPGGGGASRDETGPGGSGAGAAGRIVFTYQAASAPPGNPLVIGIVIGDGNPSVPATGNIWLLRPPSAYRRFETRFGKPVCPLQAGHRVRRGQSPSPFTVEGQAGSFERRGTILVPAVVHPNGHGAGRCRGWGPCFRGSDTRR